MIYQLLDKEEGLMQGDILDDCPLLVWETNPDGLTRGTADTIRTRVVVLTQACDLVEGKTAKVLVATVHSARQLVEHGILTARRIRDEIRTHRIYGWYFLPAGGPMGESIVDLHNLHTVPRVIADRLLQDQKRVCRISTPYREHLSQHFSVTYSRIGLPEPYPSEPE